MTANLLVVLVLSVGLASLAAMVVLTVANSCVAASSSSRRTRLGEDKRGRLMEQLTDLNLSALMPSVIGLYAAAIILSIPSDKRLEVPFEGSEALFTVLLVVIPASFFLSVGWLTATRHADESRRESENLEESSLAAKR